MPASSSSSTSAFRSIRPHQCRRRCAVSLRHLALWALVDRRIYVPPSSPLLQPTMEDMRVFSAPCNVFGGTSTHQLQDVSSRTTSATAWSASGTRPSSSTQAASSNPCRFPLLCGPSDVSMDFMEGLPKVGGKSVMMIVVDRFSKATHFVPLGHPYSEETMASAFFGDIVRPHDMPTSLVSDRDQCSHPHSERPFSAPRAPSYR